MNEADAGKPKRRPSRAYLFKTDSESSGVFASNRLYAIDRLATSPEILIKVAVLLNQRLMILPAIFWTYKTYDVPAASLCGAPARRSNKWRPFK